MERDFSRINTIFEKHAYAEWVDSVLSLREVADYSFSSWKQRGRCLSFTDYLATIQYDSIVANAPHDVNDFITFIELIYNVKYFCDNRIRKKSIFSFYHDTHIVLADLMDEVLSEMNQKAYYDPETEMCLIGEDSPQVTAAIEATEPEVASQLLQYNHRQLAGDIDKKRAILLNLANYLEGRQPELKSICSNQLVTDLNTAFNNLDIRHNNTTPRDSSHYKAKLANVPPEELEKVYDDLYQVILLAILEMDNVERRRRIRVFIQDISQKNDKEQGK